MADVNKGDPQPQLTHGQTTSTEDKITSEMENMNIDTPDPDTATTPMEGANTKDDHAKIAIPPLDEGKEFHAFVAHSSTDAEFVNDLVKKLEENYSGLKFMLADRDFTLGQAIVGNIIHKIQLSQKMVIICSPGFVKSNWSQYEAIMGIRQAIESKKQYLHVVKHGVDKVPSLLSWLTYIESSDVKFQERLVEALTDSSPLHYKLQVRDVGYGMAWSYFYSYLNIIVPSHPALEEGKPRQPDLGARIDAHLAKPENADILMPRKLFIIVPGTGACQNIETIDPRIKKRYKDSEENKKDILKLEVIRGGSKRRYQHQIWTIDYEGKRYQTLVEFATVLQPLVEMEQDNLAHFTSDDRLFQVKQFYRELTTIIDHPKNALFGKLVELVSLKEEDDSPNIIEDCFERLMNAIKSELGEDP